MANRRMFSLEIVDTDKFLEMSLASQALYFHLGMRADDDGFVSSTKKIMSFIGCGTKELQQLIDNKFIILFSSGVVVITDWKKQNYVPSDRYKSTSYTDERNQLEVLKNRYYLKIDNKMQAECNEKSDDSNMSTECIQTVYKTDTQDRLGKDRLGKVNLGKDKISKDNINKNKGSQSSPIYYPNDELLNRAFCDFVEMRKKIKKPMTERAVDLAKKELEKLSVSNITGQMDNDLAIKILNRSVMNCWQGLFPLKEKTNTGSQKGSSTDFEEKWRNA